MSGDTDEVQLRVPARPEYGRIVRVGGAALGIRQGLSFTEIDELRLAIDEAIILLLDGDVDSDREIDATFRFDGERLELELRNNGRTDLTSAAVDRFDEICSPLIDDYDIDPASAWLRLRKTPTPLD